MKKNFILVVILLFVILSVVFYLLHVYAPAYSFGLLIVANAVMAILTILGYYMVRRQVHNRPQAFVQGVYSATFTKLLVCIGGILIYALVNKPNVHKPSLFILFGIYIVYTVFETTVLSKMAKDTK